MIRKIISQIELFNIYLKKLESANYSNNKVFFLKFIIKNKFYRSSSCKNRHQKFDKNIMSKNTFIDLVLKSFLQLLPLKCF